MRSTDERVMAVRSRSRKLRRKRDSRLLVTLLFVVALPLVDLAGRTVAGGLPTPSGADAALFGTSSLFGSSAGGYVLVAVLAAAIAVAVTVFLMMRRKSTSEHADNGEEPMADDNMEGGEQ